MAALVEFNPRSGVQLFRFSVQVIGGRKVFNSQA
jgi:hypothetical protein